jgi:hypothetical protein
MKKGILILIIGLFSVACDDIIEVEDISNTAVTLLAPSDGVVLNTTTLTFSWENVEDAETYHIQIATPTFNEALQIVTDSTLTSNSFTTTLNVAAYEWRVRAKNSGYETAYTKQGFTIEE